MVLPDTAPELSRSNRYDISILCVMKMTTTWRSNIIQQLRNLSEVGCRDIILFDIMSDKYSDRALCSFCMCSLQSHGGSSWAVQTSGGVVARTCAIEAFKNYSLLTSTINAFIQLRLSRSESTLTILPNDIIHEITTFLLLIFYSEIE